MLELSKSYLITVDAINAFAINARVVNTIVVIMFAIFAPGSRQTSTFVTIGTVNTNTTILTRIGQALIDRSVAQISSISRMAITLETIRSS